MGNHVGAAMQSIREGAHADEFGLNAAGTCLA
jgi:hypothetical protein